MYEGNSRGGEKPRAPTAAWTSTTAAATSPPRSSKRAAGRDPDALTVEDLAPVDQFHIRGREATLELAHRASITAGMRALDVGGGLGGPARTLAGEFGCTVEVLDLTEEYCRAGEVLTARTGLGDLVSFSHGSALEMPYQDASFDLAWTQHSSMNNRGQGAALQGDPSRPAPRRTPGAARDHGRPDLPHPPPGPVGAGSLNKPPPTPEAIRSLIATTGFTGLSWVDETAAATQWFQQRLTAMASEDPPPLGLRLLLGPDFGEMLRNQALNLSEGRICVVQAVFERA